VDKPQEYKKIRKWLEYGSSMAAIIIGVGISSRLGIYGQKFISVDTALSIVIIAGTAMVLNKMAINIADKWYAGNRNKE
jgi:hypothetical protein